LVFRVGIQKKKEDEVLLPVLTRDNARRGVFPPGIPNASSPARVERQPAALQPPPTPRAKAAALQPSKEALEEILV
jgi:hypothetical protein